MDLAFDFRQSISEFLNEKSVPGYEPSLKSLTSFLENEEISNDNIKIYFQGVRSEILVKSLDYYIDTNNIKSFSASNTYISCIKGYFIYIITKGYIKNDELMAEFAYKTYSDKSYRYKVNKYLATKESIVNSEGFEIFDFEQVKELIENCDSIMNDDYILSQVETSKVYFNKFRSALLIKLILLTGIKYSTITKIRMTDLDLKHCSISINGLTIHLPNNMVDQFTKYAEIRECIIQKHQCDIESLFINNTGTRIATETSTTAYLLSDLTCRGDLSGIMKYAIISMIKKGINQSIIIKFTGIGGGGKNEKKSIYYYCQDTVNETMDLSSSRYLDSKIRSLEIFDIL